METCYSGINAKVANSVGRKPDDIVSGQDGRNGTKK